MAVAAALTAAVGGAPLILISRGEPLSATSASQSPVAGHPRREPAAAAALAGGRWSELPSAPIPGRWFAASVWTGRLFLVWGGAAGAGRDVPRSDGAAFDPVTSTWQVLPASPLTPRSEMASTWTGRYLFVFGGYDGPATSGHVADDGALYDPVRRSWRRLPVSPLAGGATATAVWTGREVVVLGGLPAAPNGPDRVSTDVAAYDPARNAWRRIPGLPAVSGHDVDGVEGVAAGDRVLVWMFWHHTERRGGGAQTRAGIDLASLDPATGHWTTLPSPAPETGGPAAIALWTGRDVLMPASPPWRGGGAGPLPDNLHGYRLDPVSGRRAALPHGPVDDLDPSSVWTGAALLSFNTGAYTARQGGETPRGAAAVWDPRTNTWTRLPNASWSAEPGAAALWADDQLLIWGVMTRPTADGRSSAPATIGLRYRASAG